VELNIKIVVDAQSSTNWLEVKHLLLNG